MNEIEKVLTPTPVEETKDLAQKVEDVKYPHLYLSDWPFQTVPDERFTKIWADRRAVLEDIYNILNNLSRRKPSTINLLWAWFGTGKSHTLKHMAHLCGVKFKNLLPVYTEYPKTVKSFLDLYIYFVSELGVDFILDIAEEILAGDKEQTFRRSLSSVSSDFVNALSLLKDQRLLVRRWIMGDKIHRNVLSSYGITKRIETSDDAVKILSCIFKMIELSDRYSRILWMIDEFQRIGTEKKNVLEDINTGFHSVFNSCPNSFSLFFSFSVKEKKQMFSHLSKEIIDRIGIQKIIEIPKMSSQDAFSFISDLLYEFRFDPDKVPNTFFPFDEDAVQYVISLIERTSELKPRAIMQYFSAVLEYAETKISRGEMTSISLDFARKFLS